MKSTTVAHPKLGFWISLAGMLILAAHSVIAAPDVREPLALGELLVAKGVTVNETPATGGLTLTSGSQIRTEADGRAIVNLGKLGRVTLGSEADISLTFTDGAISGELRAGWIIVSATQGVGVAIATVDGTAVADAADAVVLRIDVTGGATRVETQGKASLKADDKSEFVAAGEEVELSRENGVPAYARRTLESETPTAAPPVPGNLAEVLGASLRGAIETIALDRTLLAPAEKSLDSEHPQRVFGPDQRITQETQQSTEFIVANCTVLPQIIKAKAGCTLAFIIRLENVPFTSLVRARPFMSSSCFRIFPYYPQWVNVPAGGGTMFQINASSCPRNAYQYAQNGLVEIESQACGIVYVQVEWATPCR